MHAPSITVTGNLAATPVLRRTASEVPFVSFRIANTPSRLDRSTGAWTDQPTTWFSVTCWRGLAENVARSLRQGDRVVVTGRLSTSTWTTSDGDERSGLDVDAAHVGLDLSRAPARVVRTPLLQAGVDPGERLPDGVGEALVAQVEEAFGADGEELPAEAA